MEQETKDYIDKAINSLRDELTAVVNEQEVKMNLDIDTLEPVIEKHVKKNQKKNTTK